jgi:tRNA-Thr(GGU) m(6)t(6)A37 methyltransferase TsaA
MEEIRFKPIGVVHSQFATPADAPRQPRLSGDAAGMVEVFPEYIDGLKDLDGFSHIILLCYLHLVDGYSLDVTPAWDGQRRGLFSTRTPRRPNPIGLSIVRLTRIEGGTVHVTGIDMVDGTPLLDIKPYVPPFDDEDRPKYGWLEGRMRVRSEKCFKDDTAGAGGT